MNVTGPEPLGALGNHKRCTIIQRCTCSRNKQRMQANAFAGLYLLSTGTQYGWFASTAPLILPQGPLAGPFPSTGPLVPWAHDQNVPLHGATVLLDNRSPPRGDRFLLLGPKTSGDPMGAFQVSSRCGRVGKKLPEPRCGSQKGQKRPRPPRALDPKCPRDADGLLMFTCVFPTHVFPPSSRAGPAGKGKAGATN